VKQKFPFVMVGSIADLLDDPHRNYPVLLKRCSVAARNAQFVPWAAIIEFNLQAIELNDFNAACVLGLQWWNCDPVPPKKRRH
jgi:hypothetical protein